MAGDSTPSFERAANDATFPPFNSDKNEKQLTNMFITSTLGMNANLLYNAIQFMPTEDTHSIE